jgi:hypothetical protein
VLDGWTYFHVDVAVVFGGEVWIVWYDPSAVDQHALCVAVLMAWYISPSVCRVSVFVFGCLFCIVAWISLGTLSILHACCCWVVDAAWAMDHACRDGVVQVLVI